MFVIKDQETGYFLTAFSFQLIDDEQNKWLYTTHTGRLGTHFYPSKESAQEDYEMLEQFNREANANKKLCIEEINLDELPIGVKKYEYIE